MDFSLTDEQQAVKDLAAQILQPRAPEAEKAVFPPDGDGIDRSALRELADANLLGLCLGDDVGGSGYANTELAILLEEAGRALTRLPLVQHFAAARDLGRRSVSMDANPEAVQVMSDRLGMPVTTLSDAQSIPSPATEAAPPELSQRRTSGPRPPR